MAENKEKKPINPNKVKLLQLTGRAKEYQTELKRKAQEMGLNDYQVPNVNSIIKQWYINDIKKELGIKEDIEFKTFKQWKDEGKLVKKGEKGFTVWTRPLNSKKIEGEIKKGTRKPGEISTEDFSNFYGMAYIFHNYQVG